MASHTDSFVPKLSIESIQSGFFRVASTWSNNEEDEDSGWVVASWIKETLGRALLEQPMICGRVFKLEERSDDGELELVSNDSGIRLIEARTQMNLSEFLDLKHREEAEAQPVFWEDIEEHNPHLSLLFYVQVIL
ncbi:hypothetical protein PTKIN_Ptkin05aG0026500 [Pterospermum kingtungense]